MPEGSPDYEVADGLPEDQEEDEDGLSVILECSECDAHLKIMVGSRQDIPMVAKASNWYLRRILFTNSYVCRCPRCQ